MKTEVTLYDVYEKLGSMDAKIDDVKEEIKETKTDHGKRIKSLEGYRSRQLGMIAAVTFAVSIAWQVFSDRIKGMFT